MNILQTLQDRFASALANFTEDPQSFACMVRPAADPKFGDFQANCAMPLAKQIGTNPRELAGKIVGHLQVEDICSPPEIAGPGFINLRLRDAWLAEHLNELAADERLGVNPVTNPKRIVVDFSSPNVAKPMHVGHLRSTVIGDALCKILSFLGHHVISDNHIGDWGTQFGMIIYGYKHFLDPEAYQQDAVGELARLYRLVNNLCDYHQIKQNLPARQEELADKTAELQTASAAEPTDAKQAKAHKKSLKKLRKEIDGLQAAIKEQLAKIAAIEEDPLLSRLAADHPEIVRRSREETAKLHAGDEENRRLWQEFLPKCLAALEQIYQRLHISFDKTLGESYYDDMLADVVESLRSEGIAVESDGALCVFIEGNEAPLIIQKADGAYTYATTDLATIRYRVEQWQAEEILYVVDHRQSEHFKLLFAAAGKWGYTGLGLRHVSFGTVMGKDGKPYKTRSGDTVGLEGLLDEAVAKARLIVANNDDQKPVPELSETDRDDIAEVVGIGGIKYADLKHNRESDYIFDYDKMLAMNGDTATYMQYAYARLCGIFRKGNITPESLSGATILLNEPAERALALQLCRFEEALSVAAAESKPNLLTQYLFELAGKLSTFYEQCPVLKAENDALRQSRLRIVDVTGRVIQQGLALLGIETREKM